MAVGVRVGDALGVTEGVGVDARWVGVVVRVTVAVGGETVDSES